MTDSDRHNSPRDSQPVMETESGSRGLPYRLDQALLNIGPASAGRLTVLYKCLAAQLNAVPVSFRQAAIAISTSAAVATLEEYWGAGLKPTVAQLRMLYKLFRTVDALLTVLETPTERQSGRAHTPPQGLHGIARTRSPINPHAPVISPKAASAPPVTASYVTKSGALPGMETNHPHTDLLSSSVHQPPMPLFTPELSQGPAYLPPTPPRRFLRHSVSP